ncbi:MAG: histidine kinase [Eggerthella lenta]
MDRVIDEIILVALCLLLLPFAAFSGAHVAALLCAIVVACCFDVYPHARLRFAAAGAYELAALFVPEFSALLPVVAYVLFGERFWLVRLSWIPAAGSAAPRTSCSVPVAVPVRGRLMAWRTERADEERERYRALRDEQQGGRCRWRTRTASSWPRRITRCVATLSERSRIAREIHDNVGHLLTRSVLQVEALQVVHADDECVRGGLASVGATLHEAMDTVRKSVHDLHDDAFDLRARLDGVIGACGLDACASCTTCRTCRLPWPTAWCPSCARRCRTWRSTADATRVTCRSSSTRRSTSSSCRTTARAMASAPASADAAPAHAGIGLQTMEERVEFAGRRLRTGYRKGFRVFATMPKEPSKEKA